MRKVWSNCSALGGSLVLLLLSLAVPCILTAQPTPEPSDAGLLRAPEPNPKRGGILKWGGIANSTLYDLHQTGSIANMGPQAPMYDLLVQVDPTNWDKILPDLAKSWTISEDGLTYTRKQSLEENNYDLRRVAVYPGTGPFRHKSLEPGVVWKLERNPNYRNPALPYLDSIEIYHLDLGPKTGAACLAHTIDFCFGIDLISEEKAKKIKGLKTARIFPAPNIGLWLNAKTKPFADPRVRRAIHLVLDKPALVNVMNEVFSTVRQGWILAPDPLFAEYWKTVQERPGWRSPTAADLAEARRLMKEAGYENGIKGLDFIVRQTISFLEAMAPVAQDVLKRELKIESNIRVVASGAWYEEASRGNYDISTFAFGVTLPHVADYWANSYKTDGGYNFIPYSNPEFDALIAATARQSDPAKLKELVSRGIEILDRDVPMIMIAGAFVVDAWWDNVKGHGTAIKGGNYWEGMRNEIWWLDK